MLKYLKKKSEKIGLTMNMDKTKITKLSQHENRPIILNGKTIEEVKQYIYLEKKVKIDKKMQTTFILHCIYIYIINFVEI